MIFFENLFRLKKKIFNNHKIEVSQDINFGNKKTNDFFKKTLKKTNFYFEYGSGNSTILIDKYRKKFISVELDKKFYQLIYDNLKRKSGIIFVDMGVVGEFSYPIFKDKKKILEYIKTLNKFFTKNKFPDFILVDGRFRVACCINIYLLIKKFNRHPIVILDDYKKRNHYKILNKIFDIRKIGRMALLKIKKNNKYFLDFNEFLMDSR